MGNSCTKVVYVNTVKIETMDNFCHINVRQEKNHLFLNIKPNAMYFANLPRIYKPKHESTNLQTE